MECTNTNSLSLSSLVIVVAGVTEEVVCSVEEALSWLETGSVTRVTSATAMNEHSSRSHAIFTITLGEWGGWVSEWVSGE